MPSAFGEVAVAIYSFRLQVAEAGVGLESTPRGHEANALTPESLRPVSVNENIDDKHSFFILMGTVD